MGGPGGLLLPLVVVVVLGREQGRDQGRIQELVLLGLVPRAVLGLVTTRIRRLLLIATPSITLMLGAIFVLSRLRMRGGRIAGTRRWVPMCMRSPETLLFGAFLRFVGFCLVLMR